MFQINTTELGDQKRVVTARLSDGNYVAVWSSDEGQEEFSGQRSYGQIFQEDGTKVGAQFLVAEQPASPDVTALGDGTFVVMWNDGQSQPLIVGQSEQAFVAKKFSNDGSVVGGYESPVTLFDPYYNAGRGELIQTQSGDLVGFFSLYSTPNDALLAGSDAWEVVARRYSADLEPIGDLVQINTYLAGNQWLKGANSITETQSGDLVFVWESSVPTSDTKQAKLRVFDSDLAPVTGEVDLISSPTDDYIQTVVASLGSGGVVAAYSLDDGVGVKVFDDTYSVLHSFNLTSPAGSTFLTKDQRKMVLSQIDEERFALTWFEENPDQNSGQLIDVKTQMFANDGAPIGAPHVVAQTAVGADSLDVEVTPASLGISFMQAPSQAHEAVDGDGDGSGLFFATFEHTTNTAPVLASGYSLNEVELNILDLGGEEFISSSGPVSHGLAVQGDGKVIVAGTTRRGGDAASYEDFALVRYNPDGSIDEGFGDGGSVTTDFPTAGMDRGCAVAVLQDGTIVVAGQGGVPEANENLALANGHIAWYDPDGVLIKTEQIDTGARNEFFGVLEMPDGALMVGGRSDVSTATGASLLTFTRYLADGTLDTTFGEGGTLSQRIGDYGQQIGAMRLDGDGRIVIAGHYSDGVTSHFSVSRFLDDGRLDTAFNGTGYQVTDIEGYTGNAHDLVELSDGSLVVVGTRTNAANSANRDVLLVRYNPDGTIDTEFGDGGMVVTPGADFGAAIVEDPQGGLIVGGATYNGKDYDLSLIRYSVDGQIDHRFGVDGIKTLDLGRTERLTDLAFIDTDTLVVNGYIGPAGSGDPTDYDFATLFLEGEPANEEGNVVWYQEGAAPLLLNEAIYVSDADLTGGAGYAGTSIRLARAGGAVAEDSFYSSLSGSSELSAGSPVLIGGVSVGIVVQNSGGELRIDFSQEATEGLVNQVLRSVRYANNSDNSPASIAIDWTFDDGNDGAQGGGGALTATSTTTVNIAGVNDAPIGEAYMTGDLYVGQSLTLVDSWTDPDGIDGQPHYQWRRLEEGVWVDIAQETGSTYTLTAEDEGHQVSVEISYRDSGGTDELIEVTNLAGVIQPDSVLNGGGGADAMVGGSGDDVLWVEGNLSAPGDFWGATWSPMGRLPLEGGGRRLSSLHQPSLALGG